MERPPALVVPLLPPPPSRSPPRAPLLPPPPRAPLVSEWMFVSLAGLLRPPARLTSAPLQVVHDGIRPAARVPLLPAPPNQFPPDHSHVVDIPDDETSARPAPSLPASSTSPASALATSSLPATPTQPDQQQQQFLALVLVTSLTILMDVHHIFPSTYRCYILGAFASVWVLAGLAFPIGTFGTCKAEKVFSRHASHFAFVAFVLFIVYILYALSVNSPDVPSSSSTYLTSPSPEAARPVDTFDGLTLFYGALGGLALICHLGLWIRDCTR